MITTIIKFGLNIYYRVACQYTIGHGFFNTIAHWCNVLTWHYSTLDRVDEFKALTGFILTNPQPDITILSTATSLTDVLTLNLNTVFADSFTIGNLRLTHIGFDVELTLHAVY